MSDSIVNHVGICVTDLERSRRFYEDALGFRHWWDFGVPDELGASVLRVPAPMGLTALYLVRDGWVLELLHYAEDAARQPARERSMAEPGLTHVSFSVDDLDATLERLAGLGVEPEKPPYTVREGGSRLCFVRDPDDYRVELIEAGSRD